MASNCVAIYLAASSWPRVAVPRPSSMSSARKRISARIACGRIDSIASFTLSLADSARSTTKIMAMAVMIPEKTKRFICMRPPIIVPKRRRDIVWSRDVHCDERVAWSDFGATQPWLPQAAAHAVYTQDGCGNEADGDRD